MSKLGIEVQNEHLDLNPSITIEMERNNPLTQFDDAVVGGYSFPFDVKNTPKNARLLNYAGAVQKRIDNGGIDARVYDNGLQVLAGKIKVERTANDLNKGSKTGISCYLLTEAADFWQEIKNLNVPDVDFGGNRSFSDTDFWAHINTVANAAVNAFDYAFYPVINKGWEGISGEFPPLMNRMFYNAGQAEFLETWGLDYLETNRIVPFPYLHYVIQKIFEHVGWKAKGEILEDLYFKKITLINFRAIDWAYINPSAPPVFLPRNPVIFNIKDHVPQMTAAEFLVALKNRFGWWYDFDKASKTVTIKYLKNIATEELKDLTNYVDPVVLKTIFQNRKIYALENGVDPPDWSLVDFDGFIAQFDDLPTASEALYGHVYLATSENNYYICQQSGSGWGWESFGANVFDYRPESYTESIVSNTSIPGTEYYEDMDMMLPRWDSPGEWFARGEPGVTWGIIMSFYHGMRFNAGNTEAFPYSSPHIYDPQAIKVADWGLPYQCFETDGDDVGLYQTYWKPFLDLINASEEIEITAHLPLAEYLNLRYENQLVVGGVKMFIKTLKTKIPYDKSISLVCTRM